MIWASGLEFCSGEVQFRSLAAYESKIMKINRFDGDRAAELYDEKVGRIRTKHIMDAFRLGLYHKSSGKKYRNPFEKDSFKWVAYKNGYRSVARNSGKHFTRITP